MVDTHGIPLGIVVDEVHKRGMMVDWLAFYDQAVEAGWRVDSVVAKLEEAVLDCYGPIWFEEWRKRFQHCLTVR